MLGETRQSGEFCAGRPADEFVPAAVTDVGCEREINEDRYAVIQSLNGKAWIVCDGMGGSLGGELAAQLAIDALRQALESGEFRNASEALSSSIAEANRRIVLRRQNPAFSGMGTTVVAALLDENELAIAHAGDSRAYVIRGKEIEQLTIDHTYVQELVDRGTLSEEDALHHPQSHVLTRCLGADPRIKVDVNTFWIWDADDGAEDYLLLCSDGLYSLIEDAEIAEIVSTESPRSSCVKLVELAKARGGYDNITVSVLPLNGKLRDEDPGTRVRKKRKPTEAARPERKHLTTLQRIVLSSILSVLGVLLASLYVVLGMGS